MNSYPESEKSSHFTTQPVRSILHATQESRFYGLEVYKLDFSINGFPSKVYTQPEDRIVLVGKHEEYSTEFAVTTARPQLVAINMAWLSLSGTGLYNLQNVCRDPRKSVEEIVIFHSPIESLCHGQEITFIPFDEDTASEIQKTTLSAALELSRQLLAVWDRQRYHAWSARTNVGMPLHATLSIIENLTARDVQIFQAMKEAGADDDGFPFNINLPDERFHQPTVKLMSMVLDGVKI